MVNLDEFMPEDLQWQEQRGVVMVKGKKEVLLTNAVPIVISRCEIIDYEKGINRKLIKIQFQYCNSEWTEEVQEFTEEDIITGKFLRKLPIEVQMHNRNAAVKCFTEIIREQAVRISVQKIYRFGWTNKKFHWNENEGQISKEAEYTAALKIAEMLSKNNHVVTALVLAALHGPMKRVMLSAGIKHDFVTFLVGNTSVGKTSLAKKICKYLLYKTVVVALSSKRKELKAMLQNASDITMVVDDFNTSASNRVVSSQLQSLSEIIQTACDSGDVILDETSLEKVNNCIHIVVTSEKIIKNQSTMNRCFLVNMQKTLPKDLWDELCDMDEKRYFFIFMRSFIRFIELNYDGVVSQCKADYAHYLKEVAGKMASNVSKNRIAETLAVQHVLKKVLMGYLKSVSIDERLWKWDDECINDCIDVCGQELQQELGEMIKEEEHMNWLPTLAEIFSSDGNGKYRMAENEQKYQSGINKGKMYIGFCRNPGYISFSPSHMCRMIAKRLGMDSISPTCLGKELSYYHLAHVDKSECKQSCRWHTEKKYFHVHFRELLELADADNDIDPEWTEEYIRRFEERLFS